MKDPKYGQLPPLPEPGSSWMAKVESDEYEGIVMELAREPLHPYDDNLISFSNGLVCTVLDSWYRSREFCVAKIILPSSMLELTLKYRGEWKDSGWIRL